jgi:CubicO group peptidase (beta-lactamase class C family)
MTGTFHGGRSELSHGEPESVDVSSEGLARLDDHLRGYVDAGRLPGCLTLIARRGKIVHLAALGMADRERGTAVEPDTIFRIYSMSKPLTSVALMQLYERGEVQLEDPVDRFLPSWKRLRVYESGAYPNVQTREPERAMTVRDLLSHQSGLAYGRPEDDSPVDAAYRRCSVLNPGQTLEQMVSKLSELPLQFSPGTRWRYSVAADVCGYLVQLISGQRFDEYLRENIFEPLGMVDTSFWVAPHKLARLAANYRATADGGIELVDDPRDSAFAHAPAMLSGGGGLTATAIDYWRFAQALCEGGELDGKRVIGRKTLALMTANHLTNGADLASVALGRWSETTYQGVGFGLGFSVTLDPVASQLTGSVGEYSWGGAASTTFFVDPAEELVVIFMTQLMPSSTYNLRRELRAIVYGALT